MGPQTAPSIARLGPRDAPHQPRKQRKKNSRTAMLSRSRNRTSRTSVQQPGLILARGKGMHPRCVFGARPVSAALRGSGWPPGPAACGGTQQNHPSTTKPRRRSSACTALEKIGDCHKRPSLSSLESTRAWAAVGCPQIFSQARGTRLTKYREVFEVWGGAKRSAPADRPLSHKSKPPHKMPLC